LDPIGVGTPNVENFTSYINRLAITHKITVSSLLQCLIKEERGNNSSFNIPHLNSFYRNNSTALNGVSSKSNIFLTAFSNQVCKNNLSSLTLVPWSSVLPQHNLIRRMKGYCPFCYEYLKKNNIEIYDLLLWSFSSLTICPVHKTKLQFNCTYHDCGKVQYNLDTCSRPGYCNKCHRWLGNDFADLKRDEEVMINLDFQVWAADQIGKIISETNKLKSLPRRENIMIALNILKNKYFNDSIPNISEFFNIPIASIRFWCEGRWIPNIEALLIICYRMQISLLDLLKYGILTKESECVFHIENQNVDYKRRDFKKAIIDENKLRTDLQNILDSNEIPPPPLTAVAKRLGISVRTIQKRLPDLSRQISKKRFEYRKLEKTKRQEQFYKEIKAAVIQITNDGLYPNILRISDYISKSPLVFYEFESLKVWREIMAELSLEPKIEK